MTGTDRLSPARAALVVDDVMVNRMLAAALLKRLGWQVAEADGGQAALDWLAAHPPVQLLLLDISMPDLDGEEVCRRLRAQSAFDATRIVAYTAHAGSDDCARFLANGFCAVLVKPISIARLSETLRQLLPD